MQKDDRMSFIIQLGVLFFIPFVVAVINTILGLMILQDKLFTSITEYTVIIITGFFVLHLLYFLFIRSKYIQALL
ncbi:hypothetical protein SAMN05444392_104101 [Seinonella peptonophila]|uniref:ABC transport system permease protein n=1 Tax=Seinonella peptonophila TaxID=112248 RepID=A0A1M4X3E1_9BACL|nr:hypothetical protein SAMN05444392_104101 [Seinonella peptonophila]